MPQRAGGGGETGRSRNTRESNQEAQKGLGGLEAAQKGGGTGQAVKPMASLYYVRRANDVFPFHQCGKSDALIAGKRCHIEGKGWRLRLEAGRNLEAQLEHLR